MLLGVVDCNVVLGGLLSRLDDSPNIQVLNAILNREFRLVTSDAVLAEFAFVLKLEKYRATHSFSPDEIDEFCSILKSSSVHINAPSFVSPTITRDATDTKFLDLALAAGADFLVTNDNRHLLPLKVIGRTKIVTPHKFMLALRRHRSL